MGIAAPAPTAQRSRFWHRIGSFFGGVGAVLSFLCVTMIGAMTMFPALVGFMGLSLLPSAVGISLVVIVGAVSGFFGYLAVGRFMLRAFPPRLQGRPRYLLVYALIGLIVLSIGNVVMTFFVDPFAAADGVMAPNLQQIQAGGGVFGTFASLMTSPVIPAGNAGFLLGLAAGFVVPFCYRQLRPREFLDGPFVVFLRRFSTYSDREVLRTILRALPPGMPVAMLTATGSRAGDWNPFLIGFAGLKLRQPIRSMPVVLRSTDADWREAAEAMILKGKKIVLDLSYGSGAIAEEIGMIEKHGRFADTILLSRPGPGIDELVAARPGFAASQRVEYRGSWLRALPRFLIGGLLSGLIGVYMVLLTGVLLVLGASLLVPTGGAGATQTPVFVEGLESLGLDLGAGLTLASGIWLVAASFVFVSFFLRPVLNRAASRAIRESLRAPRTA